MRHAALWLELRRWRAAGRRARLWWRDDDAVTQTPKLDDLLRLAGEVPIAMAVIPALARPELAAALHGRPLVAVVQHGWRHANRAPHGKKSEYPEGRSAAVVAVTALVVSGLTWRFWAVERKAAPETPKPA